MKQINPLFYAAFFQLVGVIVSWYFGLEVSFVIGSVVFWVVVTRFSRRRLTVADILFTKFGLLLILAALLSVNFLLYKGIERPLK